MKINARAEKLFWYWVDERQRIWQRRFVQKQPAPWTGDHLLRDFHWTNVYRQLDRESQYVLRVLKPIPKAIDRLFATLVFRLFNRKETWAKYSLYPRANIDLKDFGQHLRRLRNEGTNPFTNAYIVNSGGQRKRRPSHGSVRDAAYLDSIKWIRKNLARLNMDRLELTPKQMHHRLQDIPCVGGFVAYQLWLDLTYTDLVSSSDNSFVFPGPGTRSGLKAIFPEERPRTELIMELQERQKFGLAHHFPWWEGKKLSLANVSNCLCEFSKFRKMREQRGKVQRYFKPVSHNAMYDSDVIL